jgi:hypothetical protein
MPQNRTVEDTNVTATIAPLGTTTVDAQVTESYSYKISVENTGGNPVDSALFTESGGHNIYTPNATLQAAISSGIPLAGGGAFSVDVVDQNLASDIRLVLGSTMGSTVHVTIRGVAST